MVSGDPDGAEVWGVAGPAGWAAKGLKVEFVWGGCADDAAAAGWPCVCAAGAGAVVWADSGTGSYGGIMRPLEAGELSARTDSW